MSHSLIAAMIAVGDITSFKKLLEDGVVDVDDTDERERTALHHAAM